MAMLALVVPKPPAWKIKEDTNQQPYQVYPKQAIAKTRRLEEIKRSWTLYLTQRITLCKKQCHVDQPQQVKMKDIEKEGHIAIGNQD